jgi:hypothetical protein
METNQHSEETATPGAPSDPEIIGVSAHAPTCASCGQVLPSTFEQATIRDLVELERMRLENERMRLESKAREQEDNTSRASMIYALLPTLLAQFETLFKSPPKPSNIDFPGVASPDFNGVSPAPAPATAPATPLDAVSSASL